MSFAIPKIAEMIRNGDALTAKEREFVARLVMAAGQQFYETTGCMFICGHAGKMESDGLPEWLFVCPAFGADFRTTARYQKVPPKKEAATE